MSSRASMTVPLADRLGLAFSLSLIHIYLLAQMLIKLQPQLFTVQVPLEVQETGLHCDVRAVLNRGAGAHVGDSGVAGAVLQCGPGGVYSVARHQHMRRNDEVGSGEQLLSLIHI